MKYDFLIVGAGLSGSIIARQMAELGKKVLILEKRTHIAGNLYDELNEVNILIQKYGPHIFHTNNSTVYDFIIQYALWTPFKLKCEVFMNGQFTPSPFNFKTIDTFYDYRSASQIKEALLSKYHTKTVSIVDLINSDNEIIREYANMLFQNDYSLYTAKQWGIKASEIDINVLKRVPVRLDYEEMYFTDKYECLPLNGYTKFIENILNHKNIVIKTNIDALDYLSLDYDNNKISVSNYEVSEKVQVVYTGAIDQLFQSKYGNLPYRTLYFEYQTLPLNSFQNAPVVAYPQEPHYTRITEYKKLPPQEIPNYSTIVYEYPLNLDSENNLEPYYPIPTSNSNLLYTRYKEYSLSFTNLHLCGRLAEFKYYNMDQIIEKALILSNTLKNR